MERYNKGYILYWRQEFESAIWRMPLLYCKVWLYLLISANWRTTLIPTKKGMNMYISPGMVVTSIQKIATDVSYRERGTNKVPNKKTIKAILRWLQSNGMIEVESNELGTVINIINWHSHQVSPDKKVTVESHSSWSLLNNNNNIINNNNNNNNNGVIFNHTHNGVISKLRNHTSNFEEYLSVTGQYIDPDTICGINYYLEKYKQYRHTEHPRLKHNQWQRVVDRIFTCEDDKTDRSFVLDINELKAIIDSYFETKFSIKVDYNILHFVEGWIKTGRFYETSF